MDVWLFIHDDVDGICAGALSLAANPDARIFFTHPEGLLEDLRLVKDTDKVIICDISLDEERIQGTLQRFTDISNKGELIYIDHHPLPENVSKKDLPRKTIRKLGVSSSELVYTFFQSRLAPMHIRIAVYGAIGDYMDDTPLIQSLMKKWDKRSLYFEAGILVQGVEGLENDYDSKRRIVQNLANNMSPSLDEDLVKTALLYTRREENALKELKNHINIEGNVAYTIDFQLKLGKTATYITKLTKAAVSVAAENQEDIIEMSMRRNDKRVDLNKLMRSLTPKFGGSGGGHPMAAGGRIRKDTFQQFIGELDQNVTAILGGKKESEKEF